MTDKLKEEIKRCQFLQKVYSDFGADYLETNEELMKDLSAALLALEGSEEEKANSLIKLMDWQ